MTGKRSREGSAEKLPEQADRRIVRDHLEQESAAPGPVATNPDAAVDLALEHARDGFDRGALMVYALDEPPFHKPAVPTGRQHSPLRSHARHRAE